MSESLGHDGRNIDARIGTLSGEGSRQKATHGIVPWTGPSPAVHTGPSYYEHPVIKKSIWAWSIPLYYYVGGVTGTSVALGAAATLLNRDGLRSLVFKSRLIGVAGSTLSAALLIHDLGMPLRFLNMLRVFRPTSPMNMGSWILVSFSAFTTLAALAEFGPAGLRNPGDGAAMLAGLLGLALAGYTGVLVAHTVVPIWQRPHRLMPVLFLASGVTASASLFDTIGGDKREQRAAAIFGTAGKLTELICAQLVQESVATVPEAARPFEEGCSGFLWKAAKILTAASLVLSIIPRRGRNLRRISGVLGTLGSLCTRFAVHYAGQQSALNPRATFHQQREGQGAYAVTGRPAITGPSGERAVSSWAAMP